MNLFSRKKITVIFTADMYTALKFMVLLYAASWA